MPQRVYIESSIISNLTARHAMREYDKLMQETTRAWWEQIAPTCQLFYSETVEFEIARGDKSAAVKRLTVLDGMSKLPTTPEIHALAADFIRASALPHKSLEDALHIATATIHKLDLLLSWNCKHIVNAYSLPIVWQVCTAHGLKCPIIATPLQALEQHNV